MNIVVKKVNELPYIATYENGLELKDMQELVGGYIECVKISDKIDMWVNEEGRLYSLPLNFFIDYGSDTLGGICGDVFFASHDDEGDVIGIEEAIDTYAAVELLMKRWTFGYCEAVDGSVVYPILEVVE